jgi:hypothetical protein
LRPWLLFELAGAERALVDLERGAPTVGRVGKYVVNREPAALADVRGPAAVVRPRRRLAVSSVDEDQAGVGFPASSDSRRVTDDCDDQVLCTGLFHRPPKERQCVHPAGLPVDERVVVVLEARLVLLRAVMMVDAEDHG